MDSRCFTCLLTYLGLQYLPTYSLTYLLSDLRLEMLLAESAVEDVHALVQVDRVRVVLIVPRLGLGLGLGLGLVSMVCDGSLSCLDAPRRGVGLTRQWLGAQWARLFREAPGCLEPPGAP